MAAATWAPLLVQPGRFVVGKQINGACRLSRDGSHEKQRGKQCTQAMHSMQAFPKAEDV
jgi:predicted YcjX-like family ATPase